VVIDPSSVSLAAISVCDAAKRSNRLPDAQQDGRDWEIVYTPLAKRTSVRNLAIVIPAKNEALNLPHVFSTLDSARYEVILVDGNSVDDTVEVARTLCPDIKVVGQTRKGKGNALACGFAVAKGDFIVMLDADGSTDPAEIPRFIKALKQGADFAKGSRLMPRGWLERHLPDAPGRELFLEQNRQLDLRDPLYRPVLRLQRLPA
jgi:glycosyltransferase involved in cell wall biosynthesis